MTLPGRRAIFSPIFGRRRTRIIKEAQAHPEVILFIDELHNVVGAGRAEGSMDAANIMHQFRIPNS